MQSASGGFPRVKALPPQDRLGALDLRELNSLRVAPEASLYIWVAIRALYRNNRIFVGFCHHQTNQSKYDSCGGTRREV